MQTDSSRVIHLSVKTAIRLFYIWNAAGQTPAALSLHYRNARPKITAMSLSRFVNSCLTPGTGSYRAAFARLKNPNATASAFQKTLPGSLRVAITRIFVCERACRAARLAAVKIARSATLTLAGCRSRSLRAFKAVLKASAQTAKPAMESHHAR